MKDITKHGKIGKIIKTEYLKNGKETTRTNIIAGVIVFAILVVATGVFILLLSSI